jgi:uncharacterized protein YbcC (UPF0753/DUF2309 family)
MSTIDDRDRSSIATSIAAACDRIAPTWPLDQFIAVNPYWGWRSSPAPQAAAALAALAGTSLTMPRSWFREEWAAGRLSNDHIDAAAAVLGDPSLATNARAVLHEPSDQAQPERSRMALITDVRDLGRGPRPGLCWTDMVTNQISQHCAAHFDSWQGSWHPPRDVDLYNGWRHQLTASHAVAWRQGASWVREQLTGLTADPMEAIVMMLDELMVPDEGREAYITTLLLSVNGWAAWCAYRGWQARLVGDDDDDDGIVALLAIRLAWEWLLRNDADDFGDPAWAVDWADSWRGASALTTAYNDDQRIDWLLQTALERTYQDTVIGALPQGRPYPGGVPEAQAVFCIDVRSEVFRRALESVTPDIHTRGFAGFFGLPISYTPVGSALTRPQLPGLLAPVLAVSETTDGKGPDTGSLSAERSATLENHQRWNRFRSAPSSVFSFVESMGLLYGPKLLKESLAHTHAPPKWEHDGLSPELANFLRLRLAMVDDDPAAAAAIGEKVLRTMGLTDGFAPLVLLCGHGSQTTNNPHAAGLDCGACGGQSGEVNARVLADLLNSVGVRTHLAEAGIEVPPTTWFVPALHNTTTDEVRLFDTELIPDTHRAQLARLECWLDAAGDRARADRSNGLALGHLRDRPDRLERAMLERANDWSQVRPEWGLAGNAAFIVAPRARTRHVDLGGRCFLHDYDWQLDTDLSVLSLIMTAPMVVTNWINMQYLASTVDNRRYGSGNKVLHNVVGGHIGVFEGNGGDLRIGLPMQSLHDGTTLRHTPLRLSVFIEAPRCGIESILREHRVVHDLVANAWLHLLRIEPSTGIVERWTPNGWETQDTKRRNGEDPTAR